MLEFDIELNRDVVLIKESVANVVRASNNQAEQLVLDKYSLSNLIATRIAAKNKYSDFEIN